MRPGGDVSAVYGVAPDPSGQPPPRAAFVMLSRSRDVEGVVTSMTRLLARFNNSATQCVSPSAHSVHALCGTFVWNRKYVCLIITHYAATDDKRAPDCPIDVARCT